MSVTAFGGIFLPLVLFVFLFRRAWLLALACVAAVLQGPSVVDVAWGGRMFGVPPFFAVGVAVAVDLLRVVGQARRVDFADGAARTGLLLWFAFGAYALASTLVLPALFGGTGVHSPLDKDGTHAALVPLAYTANHAAQAVNLALVMTMFAWLMQHRRDPALARRMLLGTGAALVLAALVGLQQRLAWNGLLPMWDAFWASNPTYAQNYRSWAGPVARVSWPFVESSYASAWFAGVLGGFLALFLAGMRRHLALAMLMIAAFALVNSMGATGLISVMMILALTSAIGLALAFSRASVRGVLLYQSSLGLLVATCLALGGWLVLREYGLLPLMQDASRQVLEGRTDTVWGDLRPHADLHSLQLLKQTWGLGVGMGSNRGSSFLISLLASVGLPGALLFLAAVGWQMRQLALRAGREAASLFFLAAGAAILLAASLAIPDQNWPGLWILLLGGAAAMLARRPQADPA